MTFSDVGIFSENQFIAEFNFSLKYDREVKSYQISFSENKKRSLCSDEMLLSVLPRKAGILIEGAHTAYIK